MYWQFATAVVCLHIETIPLCLHERFMLYIRISLGYMECGSNVHVCVQLLSLLLVQTLRAVGVGYGTPVLFTISR